MNNLMSVIGLMTILLCMLPMHAMDKEIAYLFADKDTAKCNDYRIRTYIEKSVFHHLTVHALQSPELDADIKSELLKKLHYNKIKLHGGYVGMTDKDAYHRLLRSVIVNGPVQIDYSEMYISAISVKTYPVFINGISTTLTCKLTKMRGLLLQEDDDGIVTTIFSDALCKSNDAIAKRYQELTAEQPIYQE